MPKESKKIIPDSEELFIHEAPFGEENMDVGDFPASGDGDDGQLTCDVFQTPSEIVVVAPVAGVKKEDLDIDVTDDVLTIRGRRHLDFAVEEGDYYTKECFWGNFTRSVILPESVDTARIKASFSNGILTVRIPKVEKVRSRKIQIKEE